MERKFSSKSNSNLAVSVSVKFLLCAKFAANIFGRSLDSGAIINVPWFRKKVLNPLPNDNFLDWSKLKAFADDKKIVTKKLKFVFEG